jgi:hypothetical protein
MILNQFGLYRYASSVKTEFWAVFGVLGCPRSDAPLFFSCLLWLCTVVMSSCFRYAVLTESHWTVLTIIIL